MFGSKSRIIMKYTFLVMFYYLIKQKILSFIGLKKYDYSWFYDLSNLVLLKIIKKKLLINTNQNFKDCVLSGPFKGLKVESENFVPSQILGMFENELHFLLKNKLLKKKYENLINLGVANGYYLLGLLKFGNFSKGYAIDIDTKHFRKIKELIISNNINSEVIFFDNFSKLEIYTENIKNSLLVCDIEGDEKNIIDIKKNPWLSNNDLLVEVHNDEIMQKIKRDFNSSHTIETIFNSATINYKLPNEIKNKETFNHIDKLYLSGSLRISKTPWLYLENNSK